MGPGSAPQHFMLQCIRDTRVHLDEGGRHALIRPLAPVGAVLARSSGKGRGKQAVDWRDTAAFVTGAA